MSHSTLNTVAELAEWLQQEAPLELSEAWDNTGLLVGDRSEVVERLMTCLTLNATTVSEAVERSANMIVVHHPLPFKPLAKITADTVPGALVWRLAKSGISVYSPHTAWDSAAVGINAMLAEKLALASVEPLVPSLLPGMESLGAGRCGFLPKAMPLDAVAQWLGTLMPDARLRWVLGRSATRPGHLVRKVGIACGSGGSLLPAATRQECDVLLTGEATYHTCLEAEAADLNLILFGHFASERFAMEALAQRIAGDFPALSVWCSENEKDPVRN